MALNLRQDKFVDEYMIDRNATQAAIRAGYSAATAKQIGSKLLTNIDVLTEVNKRLSEYKADNRITIERIKEEYAKLAFFDARKLFDAEGRPLPVTLLDDDTAAAISGIEVQTVGNADAGLGEIRKYRITDKKGALDSLGKHLGMFIDKSEIEIRPHSDLTDEQLDAKIAAKLASISAAARK